MRTTLPDRRITTPVTITLIAIVFFSLGLAAEQDAATQQAPPSVSKVRTVGTIKSISANTITLTTDSGSEVTVAIQPSTRLLRMAPGQADLKQATPIQLQDLQVGDRLLAGGTSTDGGKSLTATSAVVMTKADVAAKQEREREDWQKRGVGGVVKAVDAGTGTVTVSTGALGTSTPLAVKVAKQTIIRRYAPDSVKFDDAKPGTLDQIKPGDQLRARGNKSPDGNELSAEEIVSGTFRSVAGTVVSADASNSTVTLTDLATKRPVILKVTGDSQMRKLPPMMAQRIAMRLKGGTANGPSGAAAGGGRPTPASETQGGGGGGFRPGGTPDFQQMLNRLPVVTLADLQKGDAVMIVATEGSAETPSTVIILLGGVEPILAAVPSQASTMLSPWNLGGGNLGTGDAP
jgi:hypothetical protein